MSLEAAFFWLLILGFCELALASSAGSVMGAAGVLILTVCGWLVRLDLDLLAILLGATYSSVLVCLSLVQTNLEGYPGLAGIPAAANKFWLGDLSLLLVASCVYIATTGAHQFGHLYVDLAQGEGDWFEQVIGVFHLFFYRTAAFEAVLLNLFLLLALVASLSLLQVVSLQSGSGQSAVVRSISRIRLVRSFRRQVRRKNASQVRAARH